MIEVNNVTRIHHRGDTEVPALRGLSCEIAEGTFTFIVGPSGSGKSTLLYLLGALDEPTSGDIHVRGRLLSALTPSERDEYRRTEVGFIFQSFNLMKTMDAVENVLMPFLPRGITSELRERARDLLEQVGLGERLDHTPNQLSGGEQQRVAIARALLKDPRIVLADEPTGELDSQTGAEIFGYLRKLHRDKNATVIVVTHDQRYIEEGDRVLRVRDGKIDTQAENPIETV